MIHYGWKYHTRYSLSLSLSLSLSIYIYIYIYKKQWVTKHLDGQEMAAYNLKCIKLIQQPLGISTGHIFTTDSNLMDYEFQNFKEFEIFRI